MPTAVSDTMINNLPSHVLNIFRMARDYYTNLDIKHIKQMNHENSLGHTIQHNSETVIIDYLFKNFKIPIRIFTDGNDPIENREGTCAIGFTILPIFSMDNFLHGINICGFGVYAFDLTDDLSMDSIYTGLLGNLFTGDYFITGPDYSLYYNNELVNSLPKRASKDPIIGCVINSQVSLPSLKRIHTLLEKVPKLLHVGCPLIEAQMVLLNQLDAWIDLSGSIPFKYQVLPLLMFRTLKLPIHDEFGKPVIETLCKPEESLPYMTSTNEGIHKKIVKTLKKRATS